MAWTTLPRPYDRFDKAIKRHESVGGEKWADLSMSIWEKTSDHPNGRHLNSSEPEYLSTPCELRIAFAPPDLDYAKIGPFSLAIFRSLSIPSAFSDERVNSVSHSFGTQIDSGGSCVWFHFLCKNVRLLEDDGGITVKYHPETARAGAAQSPQVAGSGPSPSNTKSQPLQQADYTYTRSAFFLRSSPSAGTTLVCFGPTSNVRRTLATFVQSKAWEAVFEEPLVLFDLVLEGLFLDIDENVWNMNTVFGSTEDDVLRLAAEREGKNLSKTMPFLGLHNIAKHIIHLHEAVEASSMVVEEIIARLRVTITSSIAPQATVSPRANSANVHQQLLDRLAYRKSLFKSTALRLASLDKKVGNAISLSFNLVTQQDSMIMIKGSKTMLQDSRSMKIIAGITMLFLPTTAVASVVGSQLFDSDLIPNHLFFVMWWVAIPLTILVFGLAAIWHRWDSKRHHRHDEEQSIGVIRKATIPSLFRNKGKSTSGKSS